MKKNILGPILSVRPMIKEDIPLLVQYWFDCGDDDFIRMGIDKSQFYSREECHQVLLDIYYTPIEKTDSFFFIWLVNGEPVGHNSLNDIVKGEIANLHLHLWNSQFRGQGIGANLFCLAVLEFYKLFELKIILCEPLKNNLMPNKMLQKIGYQKWKTYTTKSSAISLTSELNCYLIDEDTSAKFLNQKSLSVGAEGILSYS